MEVLADGEWHDVEALMRVMMPLIPPGRAMRFAERARRIQLNVPAEDEVPPRVVPRSVEFQIAVGRRGIVQQTLNSWKRLDREVQDGRKVVRLRPALPHWRSKQSTSEGH